ADEAIPMADNTSHATYLFMIDMPYTPYPA
ncbi:MAG: hypothetical protein ACI8VR_003009, partial [Candidatus Azotimanducaceae bacterium]